MDYVSNRNGRSNTRQEPQQRTAVAATPPVAGIQPPSVAVDKKNDTRSKRRKKPIVIMLIVLLLVVIGLVTWFLSQASSPTSAAIDDKKYQAVFFTNGQVYFGKLRAFNNDYMKLSQVYYLQSKSDTSDEKNAKVQSANKQDSSDVELIKLGNEIHGPEDEMVVNRDQVLFFENLKSEGSVSQTITNYQSKRQ